MKPRNCYDRDYLSESAFNAHCRAYKQHYEPYGYRKNGNRRICLSPPGCCMGNTQEENNAFFRRLRDETCVDTVILSTTSEHLRAAITAGYSKSDIILQVYSINQGEVSGAETFANDVMRQLNKKDLITPFHAVLLDEPQNNNYTKDKPLHDFAVFRDFVHNYFKTEFIISDFPRPTTFHHDYQKIYSGYADSIVDDSYANQRVNWSNTLRYHSHAGWVNMMKQIGERRDLFQLAAGLQFSEVWLWGGAYCQPLDPSFVVALGHLVTFDISKSDLPLVTFDIKSGRYYLKSACAQFWIDLNKYCETAVLEDWTNRGDRLVVDGVVYCHKSNCKECDDKDVNDPLYWSETPLGKICDERSSGQIELPIKRSGQRGTVLSEPGYSPFVTDLSI